ncbi:MAG: RluA family pseudouridine synthase [Candidatus Shapirobacteria bacterium]|nr:RluA family pseudouridine synthase [Candidatus Shapirobacteria bacterium]
MEERIKIIYEDEDVLIIDKPAGIVVTSEGNTIKERTIQDWLTKNYNNNLEREGIVHRLDKGTSGLLVIGKNQEALIKLKKQFKDRSIKKKYLAMICGDASIDGEINMPISRSKYGFGKFAVSSDGKPAVTKFCRINKYRIGGKLYSLVEIDLKTGRTHQIRVHFSNLRWPLLGDRLYGGDVITDLNRPFLHSAEITLIHPKTNQEMTFKSELPADLQQILDNNE